MVPRRPAADYHCPTRTSRRSQTRRTQERLHSAEEKLEDYEEAIHELEDDLAEEIKKVWDKWRGSAEDVETLDVPLEKSDIRVDEIVLFWGARRDEQPSSPP